jgi:sterol desaturase/sphingolipid hydroxylase (fatty acid hydroxylase superfamily)
MEQPLYVVGIPIALFLLLFFLERLAPLRAARRPLFGRLMVNAGISIFALATAALIVRPAANAALGWAREEPFGLIHLVELPPAVEFVLAFLLMDLAFYYWHRANHMIPFLWRFHNVHHIDPDLDISTAFRFHFVEVALSAVFRVTQITVIGVSAWIYAAYEVVFVCATLFQHSNVRLPIALERVLNTILVTPRMHGIHHSQVRHENNSNWSVVLSYWDRLHGTLRLNIPQKEVEIGIAGYSAPADNRLWDAHVIPFARQRDYWRASNGRSAERDPRVLGVRVTRLES